MSAASGARDSRLARHPTRPLRRGTITRAPVIWFADMPAGFHNPEPWYKIRGLEAHGHRVLFVDHLGVTDPRVRNARRISSYAFGVLRGRGGARPAVPQLRLVVVPPRHRVVTAALNRALVRRQVGARAASLGMCRPILWFRFPSPELVPLIGRIGESFVVYECVDRFEAFPYPARARDALVAAERTLFARADLTIVTSEGLRDLAGRHSPRVVLHRHGVDLARFSSTPPIPAEVARLPRPVIGYTGPLDTRVDPDLIAAVAGQHPSGSVIVVGPVTDRAAHRRLRGVPNCHLLGRRPHADMTAYLHSLDVAILPYRTEAGAHDISPVKSLEYLAAGLPAVATDVPELRRFRSVMAVTTSGREFLDAVRDALDAGGVGDPESRAAAVSAQGWPDTVDALIAIVHEALAGGERRPG